MKQNEFLQEVNRGISSYSCCYTSSYFSHRQQQEVTKRTPNLGVQRLK